MATLILAALLSIGVGEPVDVIIGAESIRATYRLVDTTPSLWNRGHRYSFCTAAGRERTCTDAELTLWPTRPSAWPDWVNK